MADRDRRGHTLPTVVCCHCGLLTHAEVPSDEELTDYYRQQYRVEYHGQYLPAPHRVIREWNRGERLTRLLAPYLRPRDRIVEVGCGMGCTVKKLELAGFHAVGSGAGRRFSSFRDASNCGLAWNPACWPTCSGRRVMMWCCWCTCWSICPLRRQALRHIRAILTDRGRLYVEVPNAGAPHAASAPDVPPGTHLQLHAHHTLAMLARSVAFRVAHWLSCRRGEELKLLLDCRSETNWQVTPASYPHTLHALSEFTGSRYYLRWRYMRERLRTLLSAAAVIASCLGIACSGFSASAARIRSGPCRVRRCCSRSSAIM